MTNKTPSKDEIKNLLREVKPQALQTAKVASAHLSRKSATVKNHKVLIDPKKKG
jgi:hypothetical protein